MAEVQFGKSVGVISFGCPKNLVDTEKILFLLTRKGFNIVSRKEDADIIIINTCTFIETATEESEQAIKEICLLKRKKKSLRIIVVGCLAQRKKSKLLNKWPQIDAILGPSQGENIIKVISSIISSKESFVNTEMIPRKQGAKRLIATPKYMAYLQIAHGCSKGCTYCVIPRLRGPYRSRPMSLIIKEAKELSAMGVRELNIIAQDITEYGRDLYGRPVLVDLLYELEKIAGIHWIRLMYVYPEGVTKDLMQFLSESAKICNYLDMPMQHADDYILKKMGRMGISSDLEKNINRLREQVPNIAIRSSFIIGFPGETEERFQNLLKFISKVKIDRLGLFEYSREKGTLASMMKGQISRQLKKQRKKIVRQLQAKISKNRNKEYVKKEIEILFTDRQGGRSFRDAPEIDGFVYCLNNFQPGTFARVLICQALTHDLKGVLVEST